MTKSPLAGPVTKAEISGSRVEIVGSFAEFLTGRSGRFGGIEPHGQFDVERDRGSALDRYGVARGRTKPARVNVTS